MIQIEKKNSDSPVTPEQVTQYVNFLFQHLEQYGDAKEDIAKAIDYALGRNNKPGGLLAIAKEGEEIVGITVVLHTLMEGFIPEHILVYIATDQAQRGKGIGGKLIDSVKTALSGSIALHVDFTNPAQHLYERKGFEKKYIEMRLNNK
ncbi:MULTISPECIES: GNAT family N-acetyltransferase [unclassified Myroides]|uniref:GNAT family N-acetyltransferase n=1 Tax=unclassified Myroides TaxID=2642485 RepID=UPI003D2F6160